jgi:epoxide hydrolase-like predicted phosphatase
MTPDFVVESVPPPRRVDAILFDVGGVLVNDMIDEKVKDLAARHRVSLDRMMRTRQELRPEADRGHLSDPDFWQRILEQAGVVARPEDVEIESYMRPIEGTLDIVRELKAMGLKLGIVSNDSVEMAATRRRLFGFDDLFDAITISSMFGIIKPEAGIYSLACTRLNVEPSRCVFVDDVPQNVEAALGLGMVGILFHNAADLRVALRRAGIPIAQRDGLE